MALDLKSTDLNKSKFTEENVVKLRDQFPHLDDETLARYLIAQNNDIAGAAKKLLKAEDLKTEYWHIKKSQCINEIITGTAYLHGTDKEGRPLLVLHARLHDPDKRDLKEMIQMTLWWTEQALSKLPADKSQFVILLDRDNCENALDTEYLQKVAEIFQDLHPERLHKAIVYPTGYVYYSMWNLVLKWFMDEHTRSKVLPAITLNDVFEFVDEEYIPEALGGKCTYQFNPDDFSDPIYPEGVLASLSNTTDESLYSGGVATLVPPFSGPIVPESSFETNTSLEVPTGPVTPVEKTARMSLKHPNESGDLSKMEELLEFEETENHSDQTTTNTTTNQKQLQIPSPPQLRPLTPTKGLTVSPMSSNPDLLALVGTPHSLPLPLPLPAPLVEEGWQEYVEYERSQHSSPTGLASYTTGIERQGQKHRREEGKEELFSPATVYNDDSDEEEEDVWNDVDSVSSRRNSISSQVNQVDALPQRSTRPPLPPSQSVRIPQPLPVHETEPIDPVMTFSGSVDFQGESYMYNKNANPARIRTILFPPSQDVNDVARDIGVEVDLVNEVNGEAERGAAEGPDNEEGDDCEDLWHEVASVSGNEDGEGDDLLEEEVNEQGDLSPLTTGGDSIFSVGTITVVTAEAAATAGVLAAQSVSPGAVRTRPLTAPSRREKETIATAYGQLGMFAVFASALIVLEAAL
eukprot:CAMPEP_0184991298 /NCGR_PEP_ID=MMETSP1098-20130426/36208_1 /TAXON_ID=89044 /ORGANISM="Spumella elongata, Strain CCAP 955/1" /LENGTH=690 /DNA_ID=CAMNT_0027516699 /DNA_START=87 /DNA_END=2160 /DNA_ORIENTATION=+